jgi:hypothetical protein
MPELQCVLNLNKLHAATCTVVLLFSAVSFVRYLTTTHLPRIHSNVSSAEDTPIDQPDFEGFCAAHYKIPLCCARVTVSLDITLRRVHKG